MPASARGLITLGACDGQDALDRLDELGLDVAEVVDAGGAVGGASDEQGSNRTPRSPSKTSVVTIEKLNSSGVLDVDDLDNELVGADGDSRCLAILDGALQCNTSQRQRFATQQRLKNGGRCGIALVVNRVVSVEANGAILGSGDEEAAVSIERSDWLGGVFDQVGLYAWKRQAWQDTDEEVVSSCE